MIKKTTQLLILLVYISSTYSANIENTENKKTTIIDILNSNILIKILSSANNLKELNELLGKFGYIFTESIKFLEKTNKPNADAMRVINQYLENRFKKDYNWNKREKYYSALKALAIESKYINILKILKSAKITSSNVRTFPNFTCLALEIEALNEEKLNLLIDVGADLNLTCNLGNTALYWATLLGNVEYVKLLIKSGANPNISNKRGITPLMVASSEIVELLINAGANVNIKNNKGKTALSIAQENNNQQIIDLIQSAAGFQADHLFLK